MAEYSEVRTQGFIKVILEKTKPNQDIGKDALLKLTSLPPDKLDAGLRVLRRQGLATVTNRRGNKAGSLVTFYKEAVPQEKRDKIKTRNMEAKDTCNGSSTLNELVRELQHAEREVVRLRKALAKRLGV